MSTAPSELRRHLRRLTAAGAAAFVLSFPVQAAAQTPQAVFDRARAIEDKLGDSPTADALRKAARAYENVVLRYPISGLCDNALWQEAVLFERAYERSGDIRDRAEASKILSWLAREYPASPMVKQAKARAAILQSTPSSPGTATIVPASSTSIVTSSPVVALPSPLPTTVAAAGPSALVRAITRAPLPKGDRLTVELTAEVAFAGDRVPNPDRVFFDFPKTTAAIALGEQIKSLQSPLIKGVRIGSPSQGITRVVIELTGAPKYQTFTLYAPFRLVIDFESTTSTTSAAATAVVSPVPSPSMTPAPTPVMQPAAPPLTSPSPTPTPSPTPVVPKPTPTPVASPVVAKPAPSPTSTPATISTDASPLPASSTRRGDYSLPRQLGLRVAKIVIDPGHGGHDPGAMANGVTESELVLDVALRLEKLLLQVPGVEVVLTRRSNEFIPLEERTAIANREDADLFLSIHANSHRQPDVRGIESYFLNFASNPDAEALAARENAASVERMSTLPAIIKAITLNSKLEESRELATVLQSSLVKGLRDPSGTGRDLGVKQAPFVVLIGATMPSVLTEIGFLTNKTDAGVFKQAAQRQVIAQSLRDAIVRYQDSLKKVSNANVGARRE